VAQELFRILLFEELTGRGRAVSGIPILEEPAAIILTGKTQMGDGDDPVA